MKRKGENNIKTSTLKYNFVFLIEFIFFYNNGCKHSQNRIFFFPKNFDNKIKFINDFKKLPESFFFK